jgi:hypothetical protein
MTVDAYYSHARRLAKQHGLRIRWTLHYWNSSQKGDEVCIPAIPSRLSDAQKEASIAAAFHEIAHGLCGPCPKKEPHRRVRRRYEKGSNCLQCEVLAWQRALALVPFTPGMRQTMGVRTILDSGKNCERCGHRPIEVYRSRAANGERMICRDCAQSALVDRTWNELRARRNSMVRGGSVEAARARLNAVR